VRGSLSAGLVDQSVTPRGKRQTCGRDAITCDQFEGNAMSHIR